MFTVLLVFVTIALACTAAYFSIVGLAALFSFHFWGTIIMGVSLEAGKLMTTSYLYKYWKDINLVRKYAMASIVALLMILTSIGIFGYLMQGFQEGNSNKEVSLVKLETNQKELTRVEARLKDIEAQVSNLPNTSVRGRLQLEKAYREEATSLKTKLFQLTKEQTELKVTSLEADSHLGPIVYVAKELNVDTAKAATYLVLLVVVIFEPLTVFLTISINHVLNEKRKPDAPNESLAYKTTSRFRRTTRRAERPASSEESSPVPQASWQEDKKDEKEPVLVDVPVEELVPVVKDSESEVTITETPVKSTTQRKVIAATNSGQLIYED